MRYGLYLCSQHPETDNPQQRFEELVEQVKLASDLGFDSIWAGEHHVTAPFHYFSQFPLLARLTAYSGDMLVGTNLVLAPLQHPVHLAEQGAMLDVMTGGRFILGIGLGFRRSEFETFGIPFDSKVGRMVEAIKVIDRLWTHDNTSFPGRYYQLSDVGIRPRPLQRPRPPIWVGATVDAAVKRTAEIGDAWLMTSLPTMTDLSRQVTLYSEALERLGRPFPDEFPRMLELYVAPTRDEAIRRAGPHLTTKYSAYADWGQRELMSEGSQLDQSFSGLAQDRFVIGDPEEVAQGLRRQHIELGITHVCMRVQWPGMPQEHALECIEMLGRDVLPKLRSQHAEFRAITGG